MNASIPNPTRISVRTLTAFSLIVVGILVLLPPVAAHAAEKKVLGDVVVERGETPGSVSTSMGDIEIRGPVRGNVKSSMGDIEVYAPVGGTIHANFGDVYVNDRVEGDLDVGHGDVYLEPDAVVEGNVVLGSGEVYREGNPTVTGHVAAQGMAASMGGSGEDGRWGVAGFVGWFFGALVFAAVSVLAAVLVPRPIESSAQKIEESVGRALLVGLASVPAALLLAVVLGVSIVGIPLLLLAAPAYLAFVFFGAVVAAYFIGRRILFATGRYHGGNATAATVGALVLAATHLIPFVGGLILYALALLGAGGAILAILSRRRTPTYSSYETYVGDRRL